MPFGKYPEKSKALAAAAMGKKPEGGGAKSDGDGDDKRIAVAERHMRAMWKAMQGGDFRAAAKAALYMKDV